MRPFVVLDVVDGVGLLTLDRAERANAFGVQVVSEFRAALAAAEADDSCRVLVLAGGGDAFSGGGDVREMSESGDIPGYLRGLVAAMHDAIEALASSRLVTIAAVTGVAAGAGLGIALCCDLVFVSSRARFVGAYGAIGLTPDCGVSYLLPRVIGPRRAAAVLLASARISADEALAWGLANERVDAVTDVLERATLIAHTASHATAPTKRLAGVDLVEFTRHLRAEEDSIVAAASHPRAGELIHAFANRAAS